ncbi:MAG: glycosyltransferase family 2 protein [Candidatus Zixiibacteriota bacterium]
MNGTRAVSSDSISIVVVTCNSLPALTDCLTSLSSELRPSVDELIVVDNNSSDDSTEQVLAFFPDSKVIHNERNRGFAVACNQGARIAKGNYLVFLNPDVQVDNGSLSALVKAQENNPRAGLASARLRFSDGAFQPNCRVFPTTANILFSRGSTLSRWFGGTWYTLPDYAVTTGVEAVAATFVMTRRERFHAIGGFDERFFMFMEDTDLSLRLHQSGFVNLFVPSAGGVHAWGRGASAGRFRRAWLHHYSVWKYFLKHVPNGFSMLLLPVLLTVNLVLVGILPERRSRRPE